MLKLLFLYQPMKNGLAQVRNEYYNSKSKSPQSTKTFYRWKNQAKSDNLNYTKTKFFNRVQKACPITTQGNLNKEISMCHKEIQRLSKQILKKDRIILGMKTNSSQIKQLQAELYEVYRIVYMYEGKMKQYEKELKRLQCFVASQSSQDMQSRIQQLLESYRMQNCELQANIEQKNRTVWQLEEKIKKIQSKYLSVRRKLSTTKREISNPLKKQFPKLSNIIIMNQPSLLQKERQLKQKMNSVNSAINQYKQKQQQRRDLGQDKIQLQVQQKVQQNIELFEKKKQQSKEQLNLQNINNEAESLASGDYASPENATDSFQKTKMQYNKQKEQSRFSSEKKIYYSSIKRHVLIRKSEEFLPETSSSPQLQISPTQQEILLQTKTDGNQQDLII